MNRTNSGTLSLKKQIPVILAAFTITFILAFGMFGIGSSAVTNKNGVAVSNSPNTSVSSTNPAQSNQAQIDQLQSLVTQYQQREQQYQQREQQYQQREQQLQGQISTLQANLDQANGLLQQYQRLVQALVNRGVIQVDQQGRIYIP